MVQLTAGPSDNCLQFLYAFYGGKIRCVQRLTSTQNMDVRINKTLWPHSNFIPSFAEQEMELINRIKLCQ